MAKTADATLKLNDRVRRGAREGVVTMSRIPVRPAGFNPAIPDEHLCRIRWDGNTFSTIEDSRGLARVDGGG